jgi:GTP-binding protein
VLDLAPLDGSDPLANHATVENELALHDPQLAARPRLLALSKADLVSAERAAAQAAEWRARLGEDVPVFVTSSATGEGLAELSAELLRSVPLEAPATEALGEPELVEHVTFRPARGRGFRVEREGDGPFRVLGDGIERLVARHDLDNEDALAHVEARLRQIGVIRALEEQGFQPGDDVEIAGVVFELDP